MGLANRLTPPGDALRRLSSWLTNAALPQAALRSDRLSSYEQWRSRCPRRWPTSIERGMATVSSGELWGGLDSYRAGAWRDTPPS